MTREEILDFCEMKGQLEPENKDIYNAIIKALEQEPQTDIRDNQVKDELNRVKDELEPCEDCISREQAKAEIRKAFPTLADRVDINSILNGLPTVQAIPLDKVEQILSEIDIVKCGDWIAVQTVRDMLEKAIKEVEQ